MKKFIAVIFIAIVFLSAGLFSQEQTVKSSVQDTLPRMSFSFGSSVPHQDSLKIPRDVIIRSWVYLVMDYEPEEKADTNSYDVRKYTNDHRDGQFILMHSHRTQRNYYFYFHPLEHPKNPMMSGEIFRLNQQVLQRGLYDKLALNDSAVKYISELND